MVDVLLIRDPVCSHPMKTVRKEFHISHLLEEN